MVDRQEILRDSVRKLLPLRLSDKEIIQNLAEAVVSREDAVKALRDVKDEPLNEQRTAREEAKDLFSEDEEPEEETEGVPEEKDDEGFLSDDEGADFSFKQKRPKEVSAVDDQKILDLWEKGILATVDSKIAEMERLKNSVEEKIDKKVEKVFEGQVKKFNTVFESQRTLTLEKSNHMLEEKSKEFEELVNAKISELKELNALSSEYFKKLDSQKQFVQSMLETVEEKISSIQSEKESIFSRMTLDFSKLKTRFESFMKESEKKREELNERINKSLHLETEIVEGLLNDAKNKIDSLALSSTKDLERIVNQKIERKAHELDEIKKQFDPDTIKNTMEDLELFRKQFASNVEKSIDSFEKAKKELALYIEKREQVFEKKAALVDEKIKELDEFEKKFAQEIGVMIEKLVEKNDLQRKKAKKYS